MWRVSLGVLVAFAFAAPAFADEPLNQYEVAGATAELGSLGYDATEGAIAATPSQARALRAQGLTVTPVGAEQTAAAPSVTLPLADPTWGYDVFRPYALNPAPCQTTCAGAVNGAGNPVSLRTYYDTLAAAHPTLVERVPYGTSVNGTELVAYRVTAGADTSAQGSKPGVMFHGAQHAREWISAEVVRRGYQYVLEHSGDAASGIPAVLASTELWFIPVLNPDGYDYTFQTRATRLWRKNLRDTNGDGTIASGDGIDTNRNFSEKWSYDNEGSSGMLASETYRGPTPESEPEVSSFRALMARIKPTFHVDYHSYANLVLYPIGWQVETYGGDNPLMEALAGTDANPAVAGYDPDVGGDLYTTNGELTDTMYLQHGILSYTIELDGGSGPPVGGTTTAGNAVGSNPGGFVFQDRESDIQSVFAKNLPFMLDLAKSAPTPDQPISHIGAQVPNFVPATFPISYGSAQTVEANVRRALGPVKVKWRLEGSSTVHESSTTEFHGGKRYGKSGVYFHRMRGTVTGLAPGDQVSVWFEAGGKSSTPFTFTASPNAHRRDVLVISAEDYTGVSPNTAPTTGPAHLATYLEALADAGMPADVYDIDANGRDHADLHGVLRHYRAVVWYTGADDYVRDPGQTVGVSKRFSDQVLAIRDYLNEGGKVIVAGQRALQGAWSEYVSDDFLQYWMGAYSRAAQATTSTAASALTLVDWSPFQSPFSFSFSLSGQDFLPRFTPTSSALPVSIFPQFGSQASHVVSGTTDAVGVMTGDTVLWGFGLENVPVRTTRAELIRRGLLALGISPQSIYECMPARRASALSAAASSCVPEILWLTLGPSASFGKFVPGTARTYLASTTARVISTASDAALSVADTSANQPGRLVDGALALPAAVQVRAVNAKHPDAVFGPVSASPRTLLAYDEPVNDDAVTLEFRQAIGATDRLRKGSYSKTLTFTLSTTTP